MKFSFNWLCDYVDIKEFAKEPEKLANLLTQAGLEVESIENAARTFNNVLIGQILERNQHPNADRLTLCQVTTGSGKVHQIVCGAKNHKAQDKVVVALPGAILPGNFEIKLSKIRNIDSMGMLCSEKELGLSTESEGIMILPTDAPVGKSFSEYKGLNDIFFEVKVTPNRADALSHFGLAREIASLLEKEYNFPLKSLEENGKSSKEQIKLLVNDKTRCPRYTGRYFSGIKVGPSPDWIKTRLESLGMKSINNVVDITNYVMLELGQPLHAFDADQVSGETIIVDSSKSGETFTSFDKTEVKLTGEELVIRDGSRPVALAGVVGGLNSGVVEKTKNVFLESAYFLPAAVRRTARKHGIETDSAYRFSRGVDPEAVLLAMNRASVLLVELAGGEAFGDAYDNYPQPVVKKEVRVAIDFIRQQLGMKVDEEDFVEKIKSLGCQLAVQYDGIYLIKAPSYRHDLEFEVDFAEEYARLVGYDKVPEHIPTSEFQPAPHHLVYENEIKIHKACQAQGFSQAVNFAFTKSTWQKEFLGDVKKIQSTGLTMAENPVPIINPLSEDLNVMRVSVLPGLVKNLDFNYRHGNEFGRVYELGYSFFKGNDTYQEEERLGFALWGKNSGLWSKETGPLVLEIKEAIDEIIRSLRGRNWSWQNIPSNNVPDFLHPGQAATLNYEGKITGFIGALHPKFIDQLKLRCEVAVGEFNFDKLTIGQPRVPKYSKVPRFAAVDRDLAFVVPNKLTAGEIISEIKKAGGKLVQEVNVFDLYEGKNLPEGHKSLAFRYRVLDPDTTLSDEVLLNVQKKIIDSVSQKFSITVR
ncbi:MAG: phenylalanine--tRNA ligase subunit beta [Proteobacteria bacterium SG_bin7]|nr:MAG: phenylalanine--tRNA ligase subunit beta [Proteobacteria bacterium SG_bin7]